MFLVSPLYKVTFASIIIYDNWSRIRRGPNSTTIVSVSTDLMILPALLLVSFGGKGAVNTDQGDKHLAHTFDFLGFTYYWGKDYDLNNE